MLRSWSLKQDEVGGSLPTYRMRLYSYWGIFAFAGTLTLALPWRVVPDATSEYCVEKFFVENTYFANVNDTPGRLSLWLDCIGCLVDSSCRGTYVSNYLF